MQPNFQGQPQPTVNQDGVSVQDMMTQLGMQYLQHRMQYSQGGVSVEEVVTQPGMQYVQPGMKHTKHLGTTPSQDGVNVQEMMTQPGTQYVQLGMQYTQRDVQVQPQQLCM